MHDCDGVYVSFHLSINHCISGNFNLIRCVWKHDETMFNKKFLRSMQKYRSNLGVASVLPCLLINAFTTTIAFLFKNQVFSKSGSLTNFTFSYVIVKLDKHKMEIYHWLELMYFFKQEIRSLFNLLASENRWKGVTMADDNHVSYVYIDFYLLPNISINSSQNTLH